MNKSFNSLQIINKKAKIYAQNNDQVSKMRSKALYNLKYNALTNWITHTDKIEIHYIDNKEYYCFYYQDYSFHVPSDKIYEQIPTTQKRVLYDFESNPSIDKNLYKSEKESLTELYNNHNLNPNIYLPQNSSFNAYWSYLPI